MPPVEIDNDAAHADDEDYVDRKYHEVQDSIQPRNERVGARTGVAGVRLNCCWDDQLCFAKATGPGPH